jgi:uncharacterized protein (TIGR03437 family)
MKGGILLSFCAAFAVAAFADPAILPAYVLNGSGYQNLLAPNTVFVIFGTGLGPATLATANAPNYPAALAGTSITFTPASGGGTPISPKMVYTLATQVAGLLPSSIAPGTYAVRVTYNGVTSVPQNVNVVERSFGIATVNSAGNGTAQATIGNVNTGLSLTRYTSGSVAFGGFNWTLSPAHPGDTLVLWGTGGGADAANDDGGSSGDQTKAGNFVVNVGGQKITPLYAGASSGYPGLWQINFTLPANIAPDCFAFAQVSTSGVLSNAVTIPIAAPGQDTCSSAGFSQASLAKLQAGNDVFYAEPSIGITTIDGSPVEIVQAPFNRYSAPKWTTPYSGPKFGPCIEADFAYRGNSSPFVPDASLDAGAAISLTGPNIVAGVGVSKTPGSFGPQYFMYLPTGSLVNGGTYTIAGPGGSQIGAFTATSTLPSNFALGPIQTIDRTKPYTLTWDGSGFDTVLISLGVTDPSGKSRAVEISCRVPANPGTFTIPVEALAYLPAAPGLPGSVGNIGVSAFMAPPGALSTETIPGQTFLPSLTGGGQVDFGIFTAYLGISQKVIVQ